MEKEYQSGKNCVFTETKNTVNPSSVSALSPVLPQIGSSLHASKLSSIPDAYLSKSGAKPRQSPVKAQSKRSEGLFKFYQIIMLGPNRPEDFSMLR
jgi:hypothetical protein